MKTDAEYRQKLEAVAELLMDFTTDIEEVPSVVLLEKVREALKERGTALMQMYVYALKERRRLESVADLAAEKLRDIVAGRVLSESVAGELSYIAELLQVRAGPELGGAGRILAERERQLLMEGHTAEHDDAWENSELLWAASCYLMRGDGDPAPDWMALWPWDPKDFKPSLDPIRNLEKAGALIAADIDRQLRRYGSGTKRALWQCPAGMPAGWDAAQGVPTTDGKEGV